MANNKIAHQTFLQQQHTTKHKTYHDKEENTNKYIEYNADVPTDRRQESALRIQSIQRHKGRRDRNTQVSILSRWEQPIEG
jgi:hypothetical protein